MKDAYLKSLIEQYKEVSALETELQMNSNVTNYKLDVSAKELECRIKQIYERNRINDWFRKQLKDESV